MKLKRLETPNAFVLRDHVQLDLFNILKNRIPWKTMTWKTGRNLPRQVCHGSDCPPDIQTTLANILEKIVTDINLCHQTIRMNKITYIGYGFFCNYYRTENDYTPFHEDQYGGDIISLSFGATREFQFREKCTGKIESFNLNGGDCLYFARGVNDTHQHSVPKSKTSKDGRINITFFLQ